MYGVVTGALESHDPRLLCQTAPSVRCAGFVGARGLLAAVVSWAPEGPAACLGGQTASLGAAQGQTLIVVRGVDI